MTNGYSIQTKRIVTLYLMGFWLVFGYAIARPCIDSLFLEHYPSTSMPTAWLITALSSIFVIGLYNKVNQRLAILPLFGLASLVCAGLLAILLGAYFSGFTAAIFILYIWKELYMVVLMETYWSFADIVFSVGTARSTYGFAMAICSAGGILGNLLVGPFAKAVGSQNALWSLLFFLLLGFVITFVARNIADEKPQQKKQAPLNIGIRTVLQSKYLVPMAILVCTVQVVIGLIDYKFNGMLQENYVNTDMRTELLGNVHAAVNVFGIAIQLLNAPILKLFGIGNAFVSIPFILGSIILGFVLAPHFALILAVKIGSKSLDYSLFRGVKEILYIPLSREEKTQGKGIIDIFMYRLARGLSSLLLMLLIGLGFATYVMELSLVLVLTWLVLAIIIIRRFQQMANTEE